MAAIAHAQALSDNDADALLQASTKLEEMGDLVAAADAAAQAATVFAALGKVGLSTSATTRVRRLLDACGGAQTPATEDCLRPLPLTEREHEIVRLAAVGLSNRAIAQRLVVSVRTVEGHLYNASAKLGTNSRADFVSIFAEIAPSAARSK